MALFSKYRSIFELNYDLLDALSESELIISALGRKTNIAHDDAVMNLERLIELGLVTYRIEIGGMRPRKKPKEIKKYFTTARGIECRNHLKIAIGMLKDG